LTACFSCGITFSKAHKNYNRLLKAKILQMTFFDRRVYFEQLAAWANNVSRLHTTREIETMHTELAHDCHAHAAQLKDIVQLLLDQGLNNKPQPQLKQANVMQAAGDPLPTKYEAEVCIDCPHGYHPCPEGCSKLVGNGA
jgi:hypothetical protein